MFMEFLESLNKCVCIRLLIWSLLNFSTNERPGSASSDQSQAEQNDNTQGNKHSQLLIKFLSTIISTQSVHNMIITKTTETDSFVTYLVYVSCSCSTNHCEKYCKNNLMVLLLDIWRTKYRYLFPITLENLNVLFIAHHR